MGGQTVNGGILTSPALNNHKREDTKNNQRLRIPSTDTVATSPRQRNTTVLTCYALGIHSHLQKVNGRGTTNSLQT